MVLFQILLISDLSDDETWVKNSLSQVFPNLNIFRAMEPTELVDIKGISEAQIIITRHHLRAIHHLTLLKTVQGEHPLPHVIYLTEADEAIPNVFPTQRDGRLCS